MKLNTSMSLSFAVSSHLKLVHPILANDVLEVNDVLVPERGEDLDLPQGALAIGLVFEWRHLLDSNLDKKILFVLINVSLSYLCFGF